MSWLPHVLGLDDPAGRWYLFWSGFGADITELAAIAGLIGLWRKHTCHVAGCWRFARHSVDGTGHVVCARHHPHGAPTAASIHQTTAAKEHPMAEAGSLGRHPSTEHVLQFFEYEHLPPHLQEVSGEFHGLAMTMLRMLPDGPELTAGLRKLLEAKDCCVRAAVTAGKVSG